MKCTKSKPAEKAEPTVLFQNCEIVGVRWSGDAMAAVLATARAVENLTRFFASNDFQIGPTLASVAKEAGHE